MNGMVKIAIIGAGAYFAAAYGSPTLVATTGPVLGQYTGHIVPPALAAVAAVLLSKVL